MDLETGEVGSRDSETGEWVTNISEYDSETGEPQQSISSGPKRTTFRIYMNNKQSSCKNSPATRDTSPAILFLLPTLFVYPGITTIIIAALEIIIHIWAHKKNKTLTNKNVYYRSPMHIVVSEFCAKCQDAKSMDKICRLQEKRAHRLRSHYEYVKRIVT